MCLVIFLCALSTGEMAFVPELWLYRGRTVRVAMGTCGMLKEAGITGRVPYLESRNVNAYF